MVRAFLGSRRFRSSGGVLALAIAAALIVFAAAGVLVYYASVSVDRITVARETRLMERTTARRLAQLKDDVAGVAIWTEAYDKTARRFDAEFADVNYREYYAKYLHHDVTLVFDKHDRVVYAAVAGAAVDTAQVEPLAKGAAELMKVVRTEEAQRLRRDPLARSFERAAADQAAVRAGDKVYLLAASTIVPEDEDTKPMLPGRHPVLVSGVEVGAAYLKQLDDDFGLSGARLLAADTASAPATWLAGADGRPVAAIGWKAEQPGMGVYADAKWAILALGLAVLGAVSLLIHRLWRMARQVVRARDLAQAGDRAKSEFIANMSHEIRTPLNGVLGMAQAMETFDLSPDQRERLRVIRESGATLLTLLNDVLDLSKIEAGKVVITETAFRLEEKAERVVAMFRDVAAEKGIELLAHVAPEVQGLWTGDTLRIRQVLTNLVSNAVKFTDAGGVTVAVDGCGAGVRFRVMDTGIGFEPDMASDLFRKFEQADASTTRRYGGTGLGLSISAGLVELMGGTIMAAGRPGEGACFTVELPLKRAHADAVKPPANQGEGDGPAPRAEPAVTPDRPLRILAAEDNATNRTVLRALIEPLGAELTVVTNGREAVEAFAAERFDVILMDVQMPEMNGLDATREIRRREAEAGLVVTPVLALTANVMSHQIEEYLAAGMDGHIAKPLDVAALYAALERVVVGPDEELAA